MCRLSHHDLVFNMLLPLLGKMAASTNDLVDHSPQHPSAVPPIKSASNLVLIDNYDSFTWNVYQYLALEGAHVTVYRNDEINIEQLKSLNPTQLVISPGPGHPQKDAGVSLEAIKHFASKIPVLGVCMGEQCIFAAFGGHVEVTGEILHGKTSSLGHDGEGIYVGLPQDLPVTRYHSLAGTHPTLPDTLVVSSWVDKQEKRGDGDLESRRVIMGVRHKEYTVEGCQFHPESILTAEGRVMLRNFLKLHGGTWKENESIRLATQRLPVVNGTSTNSKSHAEPKSSQVSILENIFARRRVLVAEQKRMPSLRPENLQAAYDLNLAPPQIPFLGRLRQSDYALSLMAEIKRASPSKGIIADDVCVPAQARRYAEAGASVISVLTEPDWFRGTIDDLRFVRQSLEGMSNRPAVLRKEFVFEEYQILEARLAGADTVLLIVKMLDQATLERLYEYSQSLGMEPLVEVNTPEEMKIAASLGAKVIGVNNRNLATFDVDLETTSRLMSAAPTDSVVCALSGIFGPQDVAPYQKNGVGAVLVGEALMRASDPAKFVAELLGGSQTSTSLHTQNELLVKICGTRTPAAAKATIEAGADLIGMIMVEGKSRCVSHEIAKEISDVVHSTSRISGQKTSRSSQDSTVAQDFFKHAPRHSLCNEYRALLVGVFQNQPLSYVLERQRALDLDVVQLHGNEPVEWADLIPVPVIHAFKPTDNGFGRRGYHAAPLLDAGTGGSGQLLDSNSLAQAVSRDPGVRFLLAGGLDPENVEQQIERNGHTGSQLLGVDVSSGVTTDGQQDLDKIRRFVSAAKRAR